MKNYKDDFNCIKNASEFRVHCYNNSGYRNIGNIMLEILCL
jgi:hypothetical protein